MVDTVNNIDNINAVIEEVFNDSLLEKKKLTFKMKLTSKKKKNYSKRKRIIPKRQRIIPKRQRIIPKEKELFNKLKNNDTNNEENKNEILLKDEVNRYAIYPLKFSDIYEMYHQQLKCFWIAQEVDLSKDRDHFYKKLNEDERYFIKHILAFFASADAIVNMNIDENFLSKIKLREAQVAYRFQATMEDIHSEMYAETINNIIDNEDEKNKLYDAINNFDSIKLKKEWAEKWINNGNQYSIGQILIAFAIVEGVFFSGAFCAIYWIKHKPTKDKENLMPGLTSSNEFIARDEGLHTKFACMLYNNYISNKIDESIVHDMFNEAVEIETNFITKSLPCKLIGMNSDKMTNYIKYVADLLLVSLKYNKLYNVNECPFDFMNAISLEGKVNFFENRPTQYQKAISNNDFDDDDDF